MERPSTARTGSTPWPMTGKSAAMARRAISKRATQGGKEEPFSIAVNPDGAKLAIGFDDTAAVEVFNSRTLKRLYVADTSGFSDDLSKVAWSADGARLYAGGGYQSADGGSPIVIWQDQGRGKRTEAPLAQHSIMQLLPCGGGIAAGAQDPAFGLIAEDGAKRIWQEGVTADMRLKMRDDFTLSADGRRVRFGLGEGGEQPVLFDLAGFRLSDAPDNPAGLTPPKTTGLAVTDWGNEDAPKLNGKPIALDKYEKSRSLAIAPDASRFVLGAVWSLRAYRANGGKLWQKADFRHRLGCERQP